MLTLASFKTNRLDAFFAIAVGVLLAPAVAAAFPNGQPRPVAPFQWPRGTVLVSISMAIVLGFLTGGSLKRNIKCLELVSGLLPEPEATEFIRGNRLEGRMLVWFDWGEYAIWHLSPAIRVSLDGRRETVYSDVLLANHNRFFNGQAGGYEFLEQIRAEFVWIPRNLPAVKTLTDRGWAPIFAGSISTIFAKARTPGLRPATVSHSVRCFPGP